MEDILQYESLIYSIIGKYSSRYDREDLYQVAMMGLMDAYRHYDSSYDVKFSSYAYYYIVGEVNRYIRESSGLKVSRELIRLKREILKAKEVMEQKLGREPSTLEISLFLEVEESIILDALSATEEVKELDESSDYQKSYDENSPTLMDLRNEIMKLSEEEKQLLFHRYYQDSTQMETAQVLGMSQVQVSRKEGKILQKLRNQLVS